MGGVGMSLEIEPIEPPAGKRRSTPLALHKAISRGVLDHVWARCRYGALRGTADVYLSEEMGDGYHGGRDLWSADAGELSWAFMDHAGCCNGSSQACFHWFDVCLSAHRARWDRMAAGRGWRIVTPASSLAEALFSGSYPLLPLDKQPLCVPSFQLGKIGWEEDWGGPFWDDGSPRLGLDAFEGAERDLLFGAAIAGICWCGVCVGLRWSLMRERSPADTLAAAWLRLCGDDALRAQAAAAREQLASFDAWESEPAGPPAVRALAAQLADPRPRPWEIAGMCFRLAEAERRVGW